MHRPTALWLLGLIVSLLLVGLVSHTPIRHVIQISPCLLALVLLSSKNKLGSASALPLFLFWFILMTLIWLFLLGIAHVISGHFTPIEIALTISIGVCCILGFRTAFRGVKVRPAVESIVIFVVFLVLQYGAMRLSMTPRFSRI
ncbi:MAG TPA: hypothetical protein VGL53_16455 [Bryobacteraceae bacterium]|jgi:hypothetical protein